MKNKDTRLVFLFFLFLFSKTLKTFRRPYIFCEINWPGYEAPVTYWMPFFGNIGINDASWMYSFGGDIYMRRGSHGCINAPLYLAKTIFDNIEEGTPIICYEE